MIAKAYGGSGALKSDFTRTNKRTRKGLLEDGVKSVVRYLKNNYFDGARQDAFDLVTGNWIPRRNPSQAMFLVRDSRPMVIRSVGHSVTRTHFLNVLQMPPLAFFSGFMICAGMTLPRTSGKLSSRENNRQLFNFSQDYSLFYYFMLWITLLTVSVGFVIVHGIDYVSWPRLLPLTDIIFYTGPGFRSGHHGKGVKGVPLGSLLKRGKTRDAGDVPLATLGSKERVD